ncbi:MAG: hypothetical protein RIF41_31235, partial [Polyangiaceae bacterium]
MPVPKRAIAAVAVVGAVAVAFPTASRYAAAVELLQSFETPEPTAALTAKDVTIDGRDGPIRARIYYDPNATARRPVVIAHGVHYQGIDEGRLVPFAQDLAAAGMMVLTPELTDVIDYRITDQGVGIIADSARYLRDEAPLASAAPEVGLVGFSFAGGLSLLAAGDPAIQSDVAYVLSVGGYHDLGRVMRFLITNELETPEGTVETQAHEYGLVVAVYGVLDRFVPAPDREPLRDAFRAWLQEKRDLSREHAAKATTPEGKRLFSLLETGKLAELRPELLILMKERQEALARLSPAGKLDRVKAPVYLLHGTGDTVIPPSEARWAERELEDHPHQVLVSPLLEHVSEDSESQWR